MTEQSIKFEPSDQPDLSGGTGIQGQESSQDARIRALKVYGSVVGYIKEKKGRVRVKNLSVQTDPDKVQWSCDIE